jgi:CheY-like chemotaxis protein
MRRAVTRGTGLTRHLLAFSRRRPVNPESIDVTAHLKSMRAMLDGSLGGHINVQMTFGPGVWPVEVDTGEMELAILNLCLNARDAMANGGLIAIAVDNAVTSDEQGAPLDVVRISVTDTGHGMTGDVAARAFEPFFTTKDVSKGSGLGLPQVYGFVQQSGGRITLDSEPGRGTTVTLLLPRASSGPQSAARPTDAATPKPSHADDGRHVLLVEDDKEVSALTQEMLGSLGYSVTHVSSADAALGALANGRDIDLVVSDIMMPGGVSGLQLAREIKRRFPKLPIVLATGYVEAAATMQDREFDLLLKPYTLEALADALSQATTARQLYD